MGVPGRPMVAAAAATFNSNGLGYDRAMPHPEKRDLEHTRTRLTAWLTRTLPGSTDLEISSLSAPADTGFSSDTLLFDLERNQEGERRSEGLVIRIQPRGFSIFPSYDLGIQYRVMEALAKTDVPVPRTCWAEWGTETLGAPFYVMERLEGWVPSDNPPMHLAGKMAEDLSPAEREAVWWSGLDAMAQVHRVDPVALGLGFLDEPARGATPLEQQLHYYDAFFSWGVGDRSRYPLIDRALAWLSEERPEEGSARLCWGDSRLANQVFSGLECIGLLD